MYKHVPPPPFYRKGLCVQAALNSAIFVPNSPMCWNYKREPPHLTPFFPLIFSFTSEMI